MQGASRRSHAARQVPRRAKQVPIRTVSRCPCAALLARAVPHCPKCPFIQPVHTVLRIFMSEFPPPGTGTPCRLLPQCQCHWHATGSAECQCQWHCHYCQSPSASATGSHCQQSQSQALALPLPAVPLTGRAVAGPLPLAVGLHTK